MRIKREYRRFEDIDEIRIYDGDDYYRHAPKKFDVEELPIQELIKNVPIDIHILSLMKMEKILSFKTLAVLLLIDLTSLTKMWRADY